MLWQRFSNESYGLIGRVAAKLVGAFDFVETVYARRSLAAGEVAFGRSDIDLQIVISKPMATAEEAERLLALNRWFRTVRACCPVIGESFVVTQEEQDRMYSLDPYRASLDRRCALVLHGKPVRIPAIPIERENAVQRAVFWFRSYLPYAVRRRNRRNLHKFALEIWNASATARGLIAEPFTTRRESDESWRRLEPETYPGFADKGPDDCLRECFLEGERLHRKLRPPLPRLERPMRLETPSYRVFVVPTPSHRAPSEHWPWRTVIATPEVLDLFTHYVEPGFYLDLGPQLGELGIAPPGSAIWRRNCWRTVDPSRLRVPGFAGEVDASRHIPRSLDRLRAQIQLLERGQTPAPGDEDVKTGLADIRSCAAYYREWYPRFYEEFDDLWKLMSSPG